MSAQPVWLERVGGLYAAGSLLDAGDSESSAVVEVDGAVAHAPTARVLPRNAEDASEADDIATLVHLNEPCIVHALALRHKRDAIYTSCGSIVVAVNPWRRLPDLTSPETLQRYLAAEKGLAPHPFAVACDAYGGVLRGERQSILVSGESGAGKTETTKILLQCLAASARGVTSDSDEGAATFSASGVQAMLLEANPILEAFGNAKTLRNHNSSRFGRWVEISFDSRGALNSGAVRTYLLEKSRAVAVPSSERSFHAFYQLLASGGALRAAAEEHAVRLPDSASGCRYLRGGVALNAPDAPPDAPCALAPGIDDEADGAQLVKALSVMGLGGDLGRIARALAACLLLGNVTFSTAAEALPTSLDAPAADAAACEAAAVADTASHAALEAVASALGVAPAALAAALTVRELQLRGETMRTPRTPSQAAEARDALAKALYEGLFRLVVRGINACLQPPGAAPAPPGAAVASSDASCGVACADSAHESAPTDVGAPVCRTVGVLDIFGFETFATNGFEQLCINYANEKLQWQFNAVTFEAQAREYEAEEVPWTAGEHTSNGATLQLLEGRIGLLALLNEQCRLPRGDDATFVAAVRSTHASHPSLHAPKLPQTVFVVAHYAGRVAYSSGTFVAKSRDARPDDLVSLLAHSACAFTRALLLTDAEVAASGGNCGGNYGNCGGTGGGGSGGGGGGGSGGGGSSSLGLQFKAQLGVLLETIGRGASHYVRCLTPNRAKLAGVFEPLTVLHQLRCSGLIDAVRVARQGHPSRLTHHAFLERYHCLAPHAAIAASSDSSAEGLGAQDASSERGRRRAGALIDALRASASLGASWAEAAAALGRTKVFLQTAPYRALEVRRAATLGSAAHDLQRMCRGRAGRRRLALALAAVRCIQRIGRGMIGRATLHALRRERASSLLQSVALGWLERRRRAAALIASSVASRIAAVWRCHRAQRTFHVKRHAAVALQCAARCRRARGALKGRRKQAHDLAAAAQKAAQDVAVLRAENATLRAALRRADEAAARATIAAAAAATAEPEEKVEVKVEALAKAEAKAVTDVPVTGVPELCQLRSALQEQQAEVATLRAKLSEQAASSYKPPLMPPASPKALGTAPKATVPSAPMQDKENSSPGARSPGLVLSPALATASASAAPPPQGTRTVEGSLARALAAEAEVSRLKAQLQLRMLQREVDGRGSDKVVALKTALNGQVLQLEADVASERRHAELAAAKVAAEARAEQAEECVRRQERITAKLLKELRETKTALGAQQCTASMLLRLRGDLLAAIEGAVTRLGTVKASLDSALAPAADRFASAVLTDAHQAEEHVAAVEEAAAAAWANAEAAEERTQRAERLLETLEQRVVAQAGLVAALLRRASDRSPDALSTRRKGKRAGDEDAKGKREGDEDAKVEDAEMVDAVEKALEPMSPSPVGVLDHTLITSPLVAAARRLSAAFTPAAISMVRVSSVTRSLKGVIGVSFGACDDVDGRTGRAGGGDCGGSGGRYVAMLEDELRCTLDHLEAQREVSRELSHELARLALPFSPPPTALDTDVPATEVDVPDDVPSPLASPTLGTPVARKLHAALMEDWPGGSGQGTSSADKAAALAAAEAAADALIFGDRGLPTKLPADVQDAEAAADALLKADLALDLARQSHSGGGSHSRAFAAQLPSPVRKPEMVIDSIKHQAAAAALLDDLRNETLKSTRLEKIISRLVAELRAAKVHAASASLGGAESALGTFKQLHARLEQQLLDNGAAVCMLQGEVRRGLEAVTTA